MIWNIQLFDAVLAIDGALSAANAATVRKARSIAWEWQITAPLANDNWCGYCEDLTTAGLQWLTGAWPPSTTSKPCEYTGDPACKCDFDSINWRMFARYLMGVPVVRGVYPPNDGAGGGTPVAWEQAVPKMLRWVEGALGQTIEHGARCIEEQRDDTNRMSCHTTSYASVLAQYAEKLTWNQLNATAAAESVYAAKTSWAWSSYSMDDNGNINVSPDGGESDTW